MHLAALTIQQHAGSVRAAHLRWGASQYVGRITYVRALMNCCSSQLFRADLLKLKLCLSSFSFGKVFHRGLFLRCTSAKLDLKTWIEKAEEETLANFFVTTLKTLKNFSSCFIDRMTIKRSLSFLLGTSQQNSVQTRSINRAQCRLCCAQQKSVYGVLVGLLLETVVCLPRWLLLLWNNTLRNFVLLYGLVIKRALTKLTVRTRSTTFPTKLQWESRIPKLFLQTASASDRGPLLQTDNFTNFKGTAEKSRSIKTGWADPLSKNRWEKWVN